MQNKSTRNTIILIAVIIALGYWVYTLKSEKANRDLIEDNRKIGAEQAEIRRKHDSAVAANQAADKIDEQRIKVILQMPKVEREMASGNDDDDLRTINNN